MIKIEFNRCKRVNNMLGRIIRSDASCRTSDRVWFSAIKEIKKEGMVATSKFISLQIMYVNIFLQRLKIEPDAMRSKQWTQGGDDVSLCRIRKAIGADVDYFKWWMSFKSLFFFILFYFVSFWFARLALIHWLFNSLRQNHRVPSNRNCVPFSKEAEIEAVRNGSEWWSLRS